MVLIGSTSTRFICARLDAGREDSVLYFLGGDKRGLGAFDGMVVFGFGRGAEVSKLLTGGLL